MLLAAGRFTTPIARSSPTAIPDVSARGGEPRRVRAARRTGAPVAHAAGSVLDAARAVLVHNAWLAARIREEAPAVPVYAVEPGVPDLPGAAAGAEAVRRRYGVPDDAVVFAAAGACWRPTGGSSACCGRLPRCRRVRPRGTCCCAANRRTPRPAAGGSAGARPSAGASASPAAIGQDDQFAGAHRGRRRGRQPGLAAVPHDFHFVAAVAGRRQADPRHRPRARERCAGARSARLDDCRPARGARCRRTPDRTRWPSP